MDANRHLGFDDDLRSYEAVEYILSDMGIKVRCKACSAFRCVDDSMIRVRAATNFMARRDQNARPAHYSHVVHTLVLNLLLLQHFFYQICYLYCNSDIWCVPKT